MLEYIEPITPKHWAFFSTIIKFRIYSHKYGGFRVESDLDYATNLSTESVEFNNIYRQFFMKT
jgi:hypothetical protein